MQQCVHESDILSAFRSDIRLVILLHIIMSRPHTLSRNHQLHIHHCSIHYVDSAAQVPTLLVVEVEEPV